MSTNMEVETSHSGVMAAAGTSSSLTVSLHPLVIMNVSEHWTRARAQEGKPVQVIGALIGKAQGRSIEIMNSFELCYLMTETEIVIDREYYNTKEEQFRQVFCELDFLGWYTTGDAPPNLSDINVHKQICQINESPIFVKMNPLARNTDLPLTIYDSVIDLINGEATVLFVELNYTLATEEAERIGVDHVARVSNAECTSSSSVAEQLGAQHSAIKMLHFRVKLLLEYMKAVEAGEAPMNQDILREAYGLSHRLPVLNTGRFKEDFYTQCSDVSLMTYLCTVTKGCNSINQFVNKFNVLHERHGMGRRMRSLFF